MRRMRSNPRSSRSMRSRRRTTAPPFTESFGRALGLACRPASATWLSQGPVRRRYVVFDGPGDAGRGPERSVFGGMGSWNDPGIRRRTRKRNTTRFSARLYTALSDAILRGTRMRATDPRRQVSEGPRQRPEARCRSRFRSRAWLLEETRLLCCRCPAENAVAMREAPKRAMMSRWRTA
jgi:hypothetical protein